MAMFPTHTEQSQTLWTPNLVPDPMGVGRLCMRLWRPSIVPILRLGRESVTGVWR